MIDVWYDHERIATHDDANATESDADGSLRVLQVTPTERIVRHVYAPGTWHAAGTGLVCGNDGTNIDKCDVCSGRKRDEVAGGVSSGN